MAPAVLLYEPLPIGTVMACPLQVLESEQKHPRQNLEVNAASESRRKLPVSLQPDFDNSPARAQQEMVPSFLNLQPRPPMSTAVPGMSFLDFVRSVTSVRAAVFTQSNAVAKLFTRSRQVFTNA